MELRFIFQPNLKGIVMELSFGQWMLLSFAVVCYGLWEMGKKAVQSDAAKNAAGGFLRSFFK